jgi:hypothetical protein
MTDTNEARPCGSPSSPAAQDIEVSGGYNL